MPGTRLIGLAITLLMLSGTALGVELSPDELQKKVAESYGALDTYRAEGTISTDMGSGETSRKLVTSFTILLKKPNLYLITWSQKITPGMVQSGAVWSDGSQPYLYMSAINAYSKITSDEMALGSATGISGGAALTIPSLFLSTFKGIPVRFLQLKNIKLETPEKIGEEDCYVLRGSSSSSKQETYWISKATSLIRQHARSLERPEKSKSLFELTDEQFEQAIDDMAKSVPPEGKKNLMEVLKQARANLKTTKLKGATTELHVKVSSPKLSKSDFQFALPEGTELKDSLFGLVFKEH